MNLDQERLDNAIGLVGILSLIAFVFLCMLGAAVGLGGLIAWNRWAGILTAVVTVLLSFGVVGYFIDWDD